MRATAKREERASTSIESVAAAIIRWGQAVRSGHERAPRLGSRNLAQEARLLSRSHPLAVPATEGQRIRIAAERDGLGRIG